MYLLSNFPGFSTIFFWGAFFFLGCAVEAQCKITTTKMWIKFCWAIGVCFMLLGAVLK